MVNYLFRIKQECCESKKEMHIFSHSSKTDGGNDGLEFLSTRNSDNKVIEDGTISYSEISGLEKLRWS